MKWLIIEPNRLIEVGGEPTLELIEQVVGGLPERLSVQGPGYVRGYCDDEGVLKGKVPNALATLFYREHGYMGDQCVIHGTVALTGGDWVGDFDDIPDWVREKLLELVPRARAINDATGVRV